MMSVICLSAASATSSPTLCATMTGSPSSPLTALPAASSSGRLMPCSLSQWIASTYERRVKGRVGAAKLGFKVRMRDEATEGVDRLADDGLDVAHQVAEGEEPQLGLEMGILREVASGVAVLCSEALSWKTSPGAGRQVSRYS